MKTKIILISNALLCCAFFSSAQVKVNSSGNFIVKDYVTLGILGFGAANSNRGHLYINTPNSSGYPMYGVYSSIVAGSSAPQGDCIGVCGSANNSSNTYPTRYVGVLGQSTSSNTSGLKLSIGVAGIAGTYSNHIGVYGGYSSLPSSLSVGLYAGYFAGGVYVTGNLTASTITQSSDERLKLGILPVSSEKVTDKLRLLKPVHYNLKQIETESDSINARGETVKFMVKRYDEKSQEFQKKHYGLLAQDLQKVYPDLVYEGGDGYLEINYIELIPLLLQAIQEQQSAIEELQKQQPSFGVVNSKSKNIVSSNLAEAGEQALLLQNAPNPFSERTEIGYYLPTSVQKASLYIYDMNGRQVKQLDLQQKGNASVVIAGSQLQAGMYLYTLIADGREVDTKKMILTK